MEKFYPKKEPLCSKKFTRHVTKPSVAPETPTDTPDVDAPITPSRKSKEEQQLNSFVKSYNDSYLIGETITYISVKTLYDLKISLAKLYNIKRHITNSVGFKFLHLFENPYIFSKMYPPVITHKQSEKLEIELNIINIPEKDKLESFIIYIISNNCNNNDIYCSEKTLNYYIKKELEYSTKIINEHNLYGKQRDNLKLLENKVLLKKSIRNVTVREYITFEHYMKSTKTKYNAAGITLKTIKYQEDECTRIIRELNDYDAEDAEDDEDLVSIETISCDVLKVSGNKVLNEKQVEGLLNSINNPFSVIAGGPGVGKTTLIRAINKYFNENDLLSINLAFCGKAVRTMSHKIGDLKKSYCFTLHKFLYNEIYKEDADFTDCAVIVDEISMIDLNMLYTLLSFSDKNNTRLVFVGDNDQLPPIGIGNPFESITVNIKKEKIPYVMLDAQMRFDNQGIPDMLADFKNKSFPISEKYGKAYNMIDINNVNFNLEDFLKENKMFDRPSLMNPDGILFLTPENNKKYGKSDLNKTLQSLINENCNNSNLICKTYDNIFYNGDKVLRTHNNYTREATSGARYNGDEGIIHIDGTKKETLIRVSYWNRSKNEYGNSITNNKYEEIITVRELKDEFDLGYARTIHKSQGGEATQVVLFGPLSQHSSWRMSNGVKLLRVAISRAKNKVHMICDPNIIKDVIKKDICHSTTNMFNK